jgi:lysozyme
MRVSQKGIDLIKKFEGLRLTAYVCPAGVLTIGYGHTGSDVKPGMKIDEKEAERLLWQDTESAQQTVSSFVTAKINQNEYDALVSFVFNVGPTAFVNSTLLKLLNKGADRKVVAAEFGRWVKAGSDAAGSWPCASKGRGEEVILGEGQAPAPHAVHPRKTGYLAQEAPC